MEKYIDALKLGAKRKAEEKPTGLKKRKLAKGAKTLKKITAEEYIAKVKAPPKAKIRKQKSKKLTDTELLQKLQLQKELKQRKEKLKREKEKIATQSETAKEKEKIEKEKESQNLERVRLALFPKEKETTAPISLLDTDLQFRKLSAADRKLVKEVLKSKGNKKQQLEAVKKFIELPKAEKESFLTNELSGETKGTITELKESDEPEPVSKKTKASKKQKKTLKQQRTNQIEERYDEIDERVKAINELFSKGNIELNSYLNKKWDKEQLPNIYESLNKDIEYFITTEEIEKITSKYITEYELENIPSDVSEKTKGKKAKGKKANQDKLDAVLERVNASIDLYGQGNQDKEIFLQRKWTNSISRLEQAIKENIEITNDDINNKTEEFLDEYEEELKILKKDRTYSLKIEKKSVKSG